MKMKIMTSQKTYPLAEISTYRKHSMDYFTRDGVILRTGFSNLRDWFLFCLKELLDNAVDFLVRYYQGTESCAIVVEVFKDDKFFHLKIRNSHNNYQVSVTRQLYSIMTGVMDQNRTCIL